MVLLESLPTFFNSGTHLRSNKLFSNVCIFSALSTNLLCIQRCICQFISLACLVFIPLWYLPKLIPLFLPRYRDRLPDGFRTFLFSFSSKFVFRGDPPWGPLCAPWWLLWFLLADDLALFEESYVQGWKNYLTMEFGQTNVGEVHVFLGSNQLKVPVLLSLDNLTIKASLVSLDKKNFEILREFSNMMKTLRGIGEVVIPRRLSRIDQVHICNSTGFVVLGSRIATMELGRNGHSHVENFKNPYKLPEGQMFQSQRMFADTQREGLEFVRSWDPFGISAISLMPFIASLIFAIVWVKVYVSKGVDTQIAVQTAFTVSSYIVTAGALLIALIAFLDAQAANGTSHTVQAMPISQQPAATTTPIQVQTVQPQSSQPTGTNTPAQSVSS